MTICPLRCGFIAPVKGHSRKENLDRDYMDVLVRYSLKSNQLVGASSHTPEGCWFHPRLGHYEKQPIDGSFSHQYLSVCLSLSAPPFSLSKFNKHIFRWGFFLKRGSHHMWFLCFHLGEYKLVVPLYIKLENTWRWLNLWKGIY